MVKRVIGLAVLALLIAVAITWYAGRDDAPDAAPSLPEDPNGCAPGIYPNSDFRLDPDDGGDLTICHFERQPPGGAASYLLEGSRVLNRKQSANVRAVLRAAPRGRQQFIPCDDAAEDDRGEFFLVFTEDFGSVPFWVDNGACGENGIQAVTAKGRPIHKLDTAEVLDALGSTYGPLGPPTG